MPGLKDFILGKKDEPEVQAVAVAEPEKIEHVIPEKPTPTGNISPEMLKMILQQNQETLLAAIELIKKPGEEEQRKLDEERAKRLHMAEARVKVGRAEEFRRTHQQSICRHKRPNGTWCVQGQHFSDKRTKMFCLMCAKIVLDVPTNPEWLGHDLTPIFSGPGI